MPSGARAGDSKNSFKDKYDAYKKIVNDYLEANLPVLVLEGQGRLDDAMRYCVMSGGKRLRGVLSLAVCELLGGDANLILPLACAIEYIHAYSLVHDDLPCMDDDDFRRGMPSCHKAYGEGIAVLAGDGLLNLAFEIMLNNAVKAPRKYKFIEAAAFIANASGPDGMLGGQAMDLCADISDEAQLSSLHRLKTGKLFDAAVLAPAICLGAGEADYSALAEFSGEIGLAFQIRDDLIDMDAGEDSGERGNYVTLTGARRAGEKLREICARAADSLDRFAGRADFLRGIVSFVSEIE